MNLPDILLWFFAGAACLAAIMMIVTTRVLYAALSLMICLLSVAGIYALLQAEFLAVTQVLIYAVGVVVLVLFGIMLTHRISDKPLTSASHHWVPGILITVILFGLLVTAYTRTALPSSLGTLTTDTPVRQTGKALMSTHMIAFEVSGILLLVCLIGASLTASYFKKSS